MKKLLEVLDRLVEKGNTVIVIEHNLDVLKTAENITILEEAVDDVTSALNFCVLHEDLFVTGKGNLSLFDSILASIWKRTGPVLYTKDRSLEKFGKIYDLKF